MKNIFLCFLLLSCLTPGLYAQKPGIPLPFPLTNQPTPAPDTAKPVVKPKVKPYNAVITRNFTSLSGLFTVHQSKDTTYFEIPDSLLRRDIQLINRLRKGPAGTGVYAGEELDEKTIFFDMTADSSICIRYDLVYAEADSNSAIYKAVVKSNWSPVAASFPILTFGKDHKSYVIDVSKFLRDKTMVNSIDAKSTLAKTVNTLSLKDFYVHYIHVYPINVEVGISKNAESKGSPAEPVTLETNTSFIALPKVPMQRRYFDPRVGYFADSYFAYGDDQQKSEQRYFILRWRLEPRDEDTARWRRGELVEPKQPIVIYIDPAAPKQWRPYLIQGINDWQKAFEQAGFKHAIIGKEWPEQDSTMQLDDARYSMLNYLPSDVANAYGPQVHDPRSGEIIQTHIGWYHNVMSLLHNWYMIQTAAVDPRARSAKFDEELMGQLIRFVSSHEVGHTLGLRHNFGSSSQTPVDSLRSKTWLNLHGHTASIMDYARFNYVAQPEDHLTEDQLFPHIGDYDRWAIEWGYKSSHAPNADEDKKVLRQWIVERTSRNPLLWFGDGEDKHTDPRCQTEDLGDDPVKASTYGILNLQRILPNLPAWTHETGGIHENLKEAYQSLTDQYHRYMNHVLRYIGGSYSTLHSEEEKLPVYTPVPKKRILDALSFYDVQLFKTPEWLLNPSVASLVSLPSEPNFVADIQVKVLNSLLDIKRINKLLANEKQFGDKALSVVTYLKTLHHSIWKELESSGPVTVETYRRGLQKAWFGDLVAIITAKDEDSQETDASSLIKADLYTLRQQIAGAIARTTDTMTLIHLKDLQSRIKDLMDHKNG